MKNELIKVAILSSMSAVCLVTLLIVSLASPLIMGEDPYSLLRYVIIRLTAIVIAVPVLTGLMLAVDFALPQTGWRQSEMIRRRAVTLWLLWCLSLGPCSAGPDAFALAEPYQRSFRDQLTFIIAKHPHYAWGGASDLEKGLDCSGYLFLAAKWAGIPGITRTTSAKMAAGLGGWASREIDLQRAGACDLVFWTFRDDRPNGHVGALLLDRAGHRTVTHASQYRGVVREELNGRLREKMTGVRRLTIGD